MKIRKNLHLLLACLAPCVAGVAAATDVSIIADFEGETYGPGWTTTGEAFGDGPSARYRGQQETTGYLGKGIANSFHGGDGATGTLTSPEFRIERPYIAFLIGGGGHAGETYMKLLVDGEPVRTATGPKVNGGTSHLIADSWDVTELVGRQATIQIVDQRTGGWGHILVDHIVQSETPGLFPAGTPYVGHYKPTDYKEPYRPQFHFSPKQSWMNDINALIYLDGVYHMTYQWGHVRHGGYATSTDLLHWEDKGVALIPEKTDLKGAIPNVSGEHVFSGSGVVVSGETAKKITGSDKPALVTLYTGTGVGTCIAWSNDHGATWHNYPNNPVANPTTNASPRDPCVFWYAPEEKWVMAIFEKGTTFYDSKDLIEWEQLSNIRFGHECPDVFELALDGDSDNKKWILSDAVGKYLVGQFDGTTFIPEQKALSMKDGPDFYAPQTFYPENLPGKPIIQIAWMDRWNGGIKGAGLLRNATFPVEMGLVTYDGKMRLTRTPIQAIEKLYTDTKTFSDLTLNDPMSGDHPPRPLRDIKSKTFDMTAVFDLSEATGSAIVFNLNGRELRYDLLERQLIATGLKGPAPAPDTPFDVKPDADGLLTLRILVDWSCLEMFANDGVFSYSEQYGFDPKNEDVGIRVEGGEVKLVSLEFNQIKSTWPEKPAE